MKATQFFWGSKAVTRSVPPQSTELLCDADLARERAIATPEPGVGTLSGLSLFHLV